MSEFLPNFESLRDIIDIRLTVIFLIIWLVIVMSSALSASIAEKRSHVRIIHAVLGACVPLIYPIFIAVTLKSTRKNNTTYVEKDEPVAEALPQDDFNSGYFKSIYMDSEGNLRGPFIIELQEDIIRANCIPEVQKDFIVVEIDTNTGKSQRIRVPYSKITSCNEA